MGSNWKMKCLDIASGYNTKDKYVCRDGYVYNSKGERIINFKTFNSFKELLEYYNTKQELIINEISTKEELEDGDICVLRDGTRSIVFEDKIHYAYNSKSMLDYDNETLEYMHNDNKYDIMEVYRNKELIYKREEQLKVGDEVIIIDNEEIYSTPSNSEVEKFKIVAPINTPYGDGYLIYNRAKTFLIGEKGIKKL